MTRLHGKDGRVLLNELSVSAQVNKWRVEHRRAYTMVAALGADGESWEPGLLSGALMLGGWVDTTDGLRSEAIAANGVDDSLLVTVFPAAFTVGAPALITIADLATLGTDAEVTEAVPIAIDATPDSGVDMGAVLHGLTAETADSSATGVDGVAASSNGAVCSLHVTAYTGLTSIVVTVEHSTNNSVWATLATFTTVTALTAQRVAVTGTVNRYLRATWDVTGTGSATFAVAAARR